MVCPRESLFLLEYWCGDFTSPTLCRSPISLLASGKLGFGDSLWMDSVFRCLSNREILVSSKLDCITSVRFLGLCHVLLGEQMVVWPLSLAALIDVYPKCRFLKGDFDGIILKDLVLLGFRRQSHCLVVKLALDTDVVGMHCDRWCSPGFRWNGCSRRCLLQCYNVGYETWWINTC